MKKFLAILTAILLIYSVSASCQTTGVTVTSIGIRVNGEYINTDNFVLDGTTYVPIGDFTSIFSLFAGIYSEGNIIEINSSDNHVIFDKYDYSPATHVKSIEVEKNTMSILVDKIPISADNYSYNGVTYAPLRIITEALGCTVSYDIPTKTARIYTKNYTNFTDDIIVVYDNDKKTVTKEQFLDIANYQYKAQLSTAYLDEFKDVPELLFYNMSIQKLAEKLNIEISEEDYQQYLSIQGINAAVDSLPVKISDKETFIENVVRKDYIINLISNADLNSIYVPSDEDLILEFAKSDYSHGNWMKAKHILIAYGEDGEGLIKAEEILDKINNGADFDELMFENTEDPGVAQYPEGYIFKEGHMIEEFYQGALSLSEGEVSELVESDYGYHIIMKVNDYSTGLPFQMIKADLVNSFVENSLQKDFASMRYNLDVVMNQSAIKNPQIIEEKITEETTEKPAE